MLKVWNLIKNPRARPVQMRSFIYLCPAPDSWWIKGGWDPLGGPRGPQGPPCAPRWAYTTLELINLRFFRSRKIGTSKKIEKQKCHLQSAPSELNDFLNIFRIFFGGPRGTQGDPRGPQGGPRGKTLKI